LELEILTGRKAGRQLTKQQLNARRNVRRNTANDTDAAQTEGRAELRDSVFNPLNAELNPICHLLVLLGAHYILHVSGVRVKEILYFEYEKRKPMLCR